MRQLIKDSFVCHKNLATCIQHYRTPVCVLDWNESFSLWSYESANVGMHNTRTARTKNFLTHETAVLEMRQLIKDSFVCTSD